LEVTITTEVIMNIVKKIAIATTVLCAVTAANAQDITFGARVGYSVQSADGGDLYKTVDAIAMQKTDINMGMLGIGAALVVNIPVGPVVIAPEVGFLTRTVYNYESKPSNPIPGEETEKGKVTEMAVNIPIMIKYFPIEDLYVAAGFQLGIPIGTEECPDEGDCTEFDGKKETINLGYGQTIELPHPERTLDIGIPIGVGYMVMPNLALDFRFVLGLNKIVKWEMDLLGTGIKQTLESGKMNTFGLGATYFF
jgi:hypothetical protein